VNSKKIFLYALLVLLILSSVIPVNTISEQAVVSVFPSEGPSGVIVEVFGCGFSSRVSVTIYFDNILVGSDTTDQDGCFWTLIQVPDIELGQRTVMVRDITGRIAYTQFTVTKPIMRVSPTSGPAGANVSVYGVGLGPYQVYTLKFDNIVLEAALFTNETGGLPELVVKIPDSLLTGVHVFTLVYVGYYREYKNTRQIYYASSSVIIAQEEFEVTRGAATTDDIALLNETLSELRKELSALKLNVTSLLNELETLKASTLSNISALNNTMQELFSKLEELKNTATRLEELITALETKLNSTSEELVNVKSELSAEIGELGSKITTLNQSITQTIKQVEKFSNELEDQSSRIRDLAANHENTRAMIIAAVATGVVAIILGALAHISLRRLKYEVPGTQTSFQ